MTGDTIRPDVVLDHGGGISLVNVIADAKFRRRASAKVRTGLLHSPDEGQSRPSLRITLSGG